MVVVEREVEVFAVRFVFRCRRIQICTIMYAGRDYATL